MTEPADRALAAVDAALFAYSSLTPRLVPARQRQGHRAYDDLRAQRDLLRAWIRADGASPTPPPAAYDLPDLTAAGAAERLALDVEERLAPAVATLLTSPQPERRAGGAAWLAGSAERAVRWRLALAVNPTTVAWPGLEVAPAPPPP